MTFRIIRPMWQVLEERMKLKFVLLLFFSAILFSCTNEEQSPQNITSSETEALITSIEVGSICIICGQFIMDVKEDEDELIVLFGDNFTVAGTDNTEVLVILSSDDFIIQYNSDLWTRPIIYLGQLWIEVRIDEEDNLLLEETIDNRGLGSRPRVIYHYEDIQITTAFWGHLSIPKRVARILITGKRYRTSRGITIGSSIQEVLSLYGTPLWMIETESIETAHQELIFGFDAENDGIITYVIPDPRSNSLARENSLSISFHHRNGVVKRIAVRWM